MTAAIVVDFDSNPRSAYGVGGSTVSVRYVDKSTTNNGVINSWFWKFGDTRTFTAATSPYLVITDASTYFSVDDRVVLTTTGTLPTGLSASIVYYVLAATSTYITLSLTSGGAVVTFTGGSGSGTHSVQHGSNIQYPTTPYRGIAAGTYTIALTCNDSGSTGATTTTKTAWFKIGTGTFTPPAQTTAYRNITLFVYERSSETTPAGTCICRAKTSACNLFFMNLVINGAMTKAGKTTFDIVNGGAGTAAEIDLFESTTIGRYKNIAIIGGYDVIWSGKITKADKELLSQPGTSPQKAIYHCEAYSDVKKLSDWNIISASRGLQTGKSPGQLATLILAINTGEPDFIGTKGGYIDPSGSLMQMTLNNIDKLTAFSALTAATDYDWRTRMETMLFQYATFDGTDTIIITSAGLTVDALIGSWILFPTENQYHGGTPVPNRVGTIAWGRITDNTATVITATVSGALEVPRRDDNCLIIQIPRMDFSSDLREPTAVRTFTNGTHCVRFANADEKIDLFTKVVAKGKNAYQASNSEQPQTIIVEMIAKDAWNSDGTFFQNSTFITYKTMGYIYSYTANSDTVVLIGQDYAFKVGDVINIKAIRSNGTSFTSSSFSISAISTQIQLDNTPTTTLVLSGVPDTYSWNKYGFLFGYNIYVKSNSIYGPGLTDIYLGTDLITLQASGIDTIYGDYLQIYPSTISGVSFPHWPGTIISLRTYTPAVPQTGSPVEVHGVITKPITADTNTTYPDLEILACTALIQGSEYYQKSSMKATWFQFTANRVRDGVQLTGPTMIREGQRIGIVPYTGASTIERQVIEWTLNTNTMIVDVVLGDYVKDVWNYLDKNTAATQKALI